MALQQQNTVIESLGVYLPPLSVSTREVLDACRRKVLFPLEMMTGILSRRMARNEYSFDLAVRAAEICLARSRHTAGDIDLLICCNVSRYDAPNCFSHEPTAALRLKRQLHFDAALTFDVSNACAGVFTAILLVDCFLKAGVIQRGMVVSGEYITHLTETAQREIKGLTDPRLACLTLGDSGVAMILEKGRSLKEGFIKIELYTLGEHSQHCIGKASDKPGGSANMLTDVAKLSSTAVAEATAHALAVQKGAGWNPEEMDHLIMHQTSERTIRSAMNKVNRIYGKTVCTPANTISNLSNRGNTATTSHFVALHDHAVSGRIKSGDNIIFSVNASGLTIGTAAYLCDDLPARLRSHAETGSPQEHGSYAKNGSVWKNGARTNQITPRREPRSEPIGPAKSDPVVRITSIGVLPADQPVRRTTLDMSRAAAEACLEGSECDRSEIDVLIYCGVYRTDYVIEPATAALIAGELALHCEPAGHGPPASATPDGPRRTFCFDLQSGSAGTLKAFSVAARLIQTGIAHRVMVIASEIECNLKHPQKALLGLEETACAVILEATTGAEGFGGFSFRDFPEYIGAFCSHCDLSVPGGALEVDRDSHLEDLYIQCAGMTVNDYLAETGLNRAEVKALLAPQMSKSFLRRLTKLLEFPEAVVVMAMPGDADLYTSSLPYAFRELIDKRAVQPGDLGLCLALGSGIQAGCAVYRF